MSMILYDDGCYFCLVPDVKNHGSSSFEKVFNLGLLLR